MHTRRRKFAQIRKGLFHQLTPLFKGNVSCLLILESIVNKFTLSLYLPKVSMVSLIAMLIFNKFWIMLFRLSICRSFNYLVHLSPFLASIMSFKYLDSFLSNKQTDTSPTMPHSTSPMMSVLKIKDPTPSNELNDYNFYH